MPHEGSIASRNFDRILDTPKVANCLQEDNQGNESVDHHSCIENSEYLDVSNPIHNRSLVLDRLLGRLIDNSSQLMFDGLLLGGRLDKCGHHGFIGLLLGGKIVNSGHAEATDYGDFRDDEKVFPELYSWLITWAVLLQTFFLLMCFVRDAFNLFALASHLCISGGNPKEMYVQEEHQIIAQVRQAEQDSHKDVPIEVFVQAAEK